MTGPDNGRAAQFEQAGRFGDAERVYLDILASNEADFGAWFLLARLYFRTGRLDEAITALERVTAASDGATADQRQQAASLLEHVYSLRSREWLEALDAGNADPDEAFVFGRGLVNRQRWEEGRRLLERLAVVRPDDPQVHYWLAQALLNLGETSAGFESFTRSVELAPANHRLRLELAQSLEREDELAQAEALLTGIIVSAADAVVIGDARRHLAAVRARLAWQAGDPAVGSMLEEALALDSDNLLIGLMLGDLRAREGRLEEAISLYEGAAARLAGEPGRLAPVHARLSGLYLRKSDLLSAAVARGEASADEVIDLARKLSQLGLHEAVAGLTEPAIVAFPDNPQLHFWYGRSLLMLGQHDQGVAAIEQSVELSPPNPLLLLELGGGYSRAGRLAEAAQVFQEVVATSRVPAVQRQARRDLGLVRARMFEEAGELDAASSELESLLTEYPGDRALIFDSGRLLVMLDRVDEADERLGRLLREMPRDRAIRLRMAQVYRDAGHYTRAMALYEELIGMDPANLLMRIEAGRLQLSAGEFDRAFGILSEVLDLATGLEAGPDRRTADALDVILRELVDLAVDLIQAGDLEDAERVLTGVVELQPELPRVHFLLSEVHREQGDPVRQAERLERVVALAPGNLLMQRRLAIAWTRAERPDHAIPLLEGALRSFPLDSELRVYLADSLADQGDSARAREEYLRLLQLRPADEWRLRALDGLGLAEVADALESDDAARAIELAQSLLALAPDEPEAGLAMARAWRLGGEDAKAEAAYLRVLELSLDSAEARLDLAGLYAGAGREDEAIELLNELARERPATRQTSAASTLLNNLLMERAHRVIAGAPLAPDPEAHLLEAGAWMFELEGHAAALLVFEHMVREYPGSAEAYYWFGRLHVLLERYSDSIILFKRSVDLVPDEPRYHAALGRAYRDAQLPRQAIESMEQALLLEGDDAELRLELAAIHDAAGDSAAARPHLARVQAYAADDEAFGAARVALGMPADPDRVDEGEIDEAIGLIDPGLEGLPASRAARLYLAGLLVRRDRTDDALTLLVEIADSDADPAIRQEAERRLTGVLSQQSRALITDLERGSGAGDEARQLGMMLVQRAQPAEAIRLLEVATARMAQDPQLWYWLGRARMLSNDIAPGLEALERSVRLAGDNQVLRFELALGYQRAGRYRQAEEQFDTVAIHAEDPALRRDAKRLAMRARGQHLARTGERSAALALFDEVLGGAPGDTLTLMERAQVLLALGRQAEADRTFERLLEISPEDVALRMRLSLLYRSRGETIKSLSQLAMVIQQAPASPEAGQARDMLGFSKGLELASSGDLEEAGEVFERLLTAAPNDPVTRYQLGLVLYQQRRLAEAEIHLTRAIMLDPSHQETRLLLGRVYEVLERRDDAIRVYEEAVTIDRESQPGRDALASLTVLYSERFQQMIAARRIDEAAGIMRRVVDNAPDNVAARINLAQLYLQLRRDDDALREIDAVLKLRSDNVQANHMAAMIHASAGRHMQAIEAYARAISLDDDEERAAAAALDLVIEVARLMLTEHRPYAAIRQLRGLADHGRADGRAWTMLATIYHQLGRNDDAIRAYREAVRHVPDNVSTRFNLAELYERSNDSDLALVQYREIVRRGSPGNRFVEEARRRADILRDRLALFTSQLRYSLIVGESVISEQDIDQTGALNSAFTTQIAYNLGTNFRLSPAYHVRLDTGLIYVGNHSTEDDILVTRAGVVGNANHLRHYHSGSVHLSRLSDLMRDRDGGSTANVSLSGGFRLRDPLSLFSVRGEGRISETGESVIVRTERRRVGFDPGPGNPRLLTTLNERYPVPAAATESTAEGPEVPGLPAVESPGESMAGMRLYAGAWTLLRQGDLVTAEERFHEVLALAPDDPMTLLHLGIIRQRRIDHAGAEGFYLRSLAADPDNPVARLWLADLYVEMGRADDAGALLDELISDDSVADLWRSAAGNLRQMIAQKVSTAQDPVAYRAALDDAGFSRGLAAIAQGRYDDALAILQSVLDVHPDDPLARLNTGVALQQLGRFPEAEAEFQRIRDVDPDNLNAVFRLGLLYTETGRAHQSLPLLERVLAEAGAHPIGARAEAELERIEQERLGMLTGLAAERTDPLNWAIQYQAYYSGNSLPGRNLTETHAYGAGFGLSFASVHTGEWLCNYTYGVRNNEDPWGTDYAYDSHELSLSWRRAVPNLFGLFGAMDNIPGMSGVLALDHEHRQYRHPDTNALHADGVSRRRTLDTTTFTAALNYIIPGYDRMSFSLSYSRGLSRSNLPVGLVHDPDGNPVAFQSTGLGDARSEFVNLGMSFRF